MSSEILQAEALLLARRRPDPAGLQPRNVCFPLSVDAFLEGDCGVVKRLGGSGAALPGRPAHRGHEHRPGEEAQARPEAAGDAAGGRPLVSSGGRLELLRRHQRRGPCVRALGVERGQPDSGFPAVHIANAYSSGVGSGQSKLACTEFLSAVE